MEITRKARGSEISEQAQRVFLLWNEHNVMNRDEIISDLHSMDAGMDCVVSYFEKPDAAIEEEQLKNEFEGTHQLLVIWVTVEMLQATVPDKLPIGYCIAQKQNVPILPILNDNDLFPLYKEKFGSVHCVSRSDSEYRVKLKSQMEQFLASKELIERIKEKAFSSVIFASYRKHEIREARRFMKAFHDLEGFESVSVWYDNFLKAGEDFDHAIKDKITKCNALVLVVTPDLTTVGNYVQEKEYPFVLETGKPVVSVEVISTSQAKFSDLFPGAEQPIPLNDTNVLQKTFRKVLGESAFTKQLDSERAYLLGRAYLMGIGVEREFDRALRLLSEAANDYTTTAIDAANLLANIYKDGTIYLDYNKALQWYERAFSIKKMLGKEDLSTAVTCNNIASVYNYQGKYHEALEWNQKVLDIREKVLGKEHKDTAIAYNNIGSVYSVQGVYPLALEWYQKALNIQVNVLDKEHLDTAITYNNIASAYDKLGAYPKALELYQKALDIREKKLGEEHPDTATSYNYIAGIHASLGEYTKALEWNYKALAIREKVLGEKHPITAITYNDIGLIHSDQKEYPQSLEWYLKALAIQERILGMEHQDTACTYNNIAGVYRNQQEYSKALEWNQKALDICEKVLGKEHSNTAITYNNMAFVYDKQKKYLKALEFYQKALNINEKVLGKEHPFTASIYNNIAGVYCNQGEYKNALECFQKSLAILVKVLGDKHPHTIATKNNIAIVIRLQRAG
jgi:tetratricopeptide (TPR) repeat protein